MTLTKNTLWMIAAGLFIALVAVAAYKALPILYPEVTRTAALDPDCDLRAGPCTSDLPEGRVSFAIKTPGIPLVKPLDLEVRLEGLEAESVEVDFVGIGMNMGFNRPRLTAQDGNRYTGSGMLPVCIRAAMEWEARVLIKTDAGLMVAPFRFITVKDGAPSPGAQ